MRRLGLFLAALSWLSFSLVPTAGAASPWTSTTHIFVAEGSPAAVAALAAPSEAAVAATGERDDDRSANGESPNFTLQEGRVRWHQGPPVEYRMLDVPFQHAEQAVERSERTLDEFITTRTFRHRDRTDQVNPCTGQPSTIRWGPIDGPGKIVAQTTICRNLANHEIGGFEMVFDSGDGWSIGPDGDARTYDVQNVATHEWGHVAGLDHVTGPRDTCLTMYFATSPEETEQRTLGWGDKRGLDVLYDTDDTSPGPGCGR